jgi:hypothetical protein
MRKGQSGIIIASKENEKNKNKDGMKLRLQTRAHLAPSSS